MGRGSGKVFRHDPPGSQMEYALLDCFWQHCRGLILRLTALCLVPVVLHRA